MWKSINILYSNVEKEFDDSILIKMPHSSEYDGYCFYHTKKLVNYGRNCGSLQISYNNDFEFRLKKYGNGRYNKYKVLNEIVIGYKEFEKAFNVIDENITSPKFKDEYETHKPKEIKPIDSKVLDELTDIDDED